MAGTQFSATVVAAELTLAFETQYVSGGLNQKLMALPRGIVRGFRPVPTANVDEIKLELDSMMLDSMMRAVGFAPGNAYVVTYRTVLEPVLDLSGEAAGNYYVAFVPNYTIGATTDGQWRWYTEAEFEAGGIATDNGVFAFAVKTDGGIVDAYNIWFAGQSPGDGTYFLREDVDNFKSDQGPNEKALVVDWLPNPQFDGFDQQPAGVTFDDATVHNGGGSIAITATISEDLADVHPVWRDGTTQDPQATVVVQYWFSTDGSYAASSPANIDVLFIDASNVTRAASAEFAAGRAPTYREIPTATGTPFTMIRYEVKIPDGVPIDSVSFGLEVNTFTTAGILYLGRIQAWLIHRPSSEPGDFSRSFRPVVHRGGRHENLLLRSFVSGSSDRPLWQIGPNTSDNPSVLIVKPTDATQDSRVEIGAGGSAKGQLRLRGDNTSSSWLELEKADLRVDTIRGETSSIVDILQQTTGASTGILRVGLMRSLTGIHTMQTTSGSFTGHVLNVGSLACNDANIIMPTAGNKDGLGGSPVAHALYEATITKGFVVFALGGGAPHFTHKQSLGVTSITVGTTNINIVLEKTMAVGDYPVMVSVSNTDYGVIVRGVGTLDFDIQVYDTDTGAGIDPQTIAPTIFCMWTGEEA